MVKEPTTGAAKVAAFLLSQPPEVAGKLIQHLDPDVVAEVADAMTRLDPSGSSAEAVDASYLELARVLHGGKHIKACDDQKLAAILQGSLGAERAERVLADLRTRRVHERPFLELEQHPPERVHWVLRTESPTVCALVLAHVDPWLSAAVLSLCDSERVVAVVKRMASLHPPAFGVMRTICEELLERLEAAGEAAAGAPTDTLRTIAEMLNFSKGDLERVVLEGLESEDAEAASEVREHMFTWEDIAEIDRRAMQKVLGTVDTKTLSLALKACSPGVEANIMDNLSSRVADMVREERELTGPVPMSEVEAARNEVMVNVRALIESGEFSPARGGEELVE